MDNYLVFMYEEEKFLVLFNLVTLPASSTGRGRDLVRSRGFGGHVKLKRPSNLFPPLRHL